MTAVRIAVGRVNAAVLRAALAVWAVIRTATLRPETLPMAEPPDESLFSVRKGAVGASATGSARGTAISSTTKLA